MIIHFMNLLFVQFLVYTKHKFFANEANVNACIHLRVQKEIIYLYEFHADFYFSMFCKKKRSKEALKNHWIALERLYADFWSKRKMKSLFLRSLGVYDHVNEVIDKSRFHEYFVYFTLIQKCIIVENVSISK